MSALSAIRPAPNAPRRPLSKRAVVFARPVSASELSHSPNRARAWARVMVWAVACLGAAVLIPRVMM